MERRYLIAGNWKLNKTVSEALDMIRDFTRLVGAVRDCDIVVAPSYTALWPIGQRLRESRVELAAQDLYFENSGAFTGAVSGVQLKEVGCKYVLVGHSERRELFGETLESSAKRMEAAFEAGLIPILCIGETQKERDSGSTNEVVGEQLDAAISHFDLDTLMGMVVAYEPVWAIGTGKVATPLQAQEVHRMIRERLRTRDVDLAERTRILYGGSVKPQNAAELMSQPDIDGALVGGASLKAEDFAEIVKARPFLAS
tara:strand:+ start:172 stop:939 length:768 start_codon:yes stop_codon:yes gene_type:complete